MTHEDYIRQFNLSGWSPEALISLFYILDRLYLEYTPEQAHDMLTTFWTNADSIYNSINNNYASPIELIKVSLDKIKNN